MCFGFCVCFAVFLPCFYGSWDCANGWFQRSCFWISLETVVNRVDCMIQCFQLYFEVHWSTSFPSLAFQLFLVGKHCMRWLWLQVPRIPWTIQESCEGWARAWKCQIWMWTKVRQFLWHYAKQTNRVTSWTVNIWAVQLHVRWQSCHRRKIQIYIL